MKTARMVVVLVAGVGLLATSLSGEAGAPWRQAAVERELDAVTDADERTPPPAAGDLAALLAQANRLGFEQNQWSQAIELYRRATRLAPDGAVPLNLLGIALVNGGQPEAALPAFRRSFELDPVWNKDARGGYANLRFGSLWAIERLLAEGRYAAAADFARFARQAFPDDGELRAEATKALLRAGRHDEVATGDSVLEQHLVRADRRLAAGDYAGAEQAFADAIRLAPDDPELEARIAALCRSHVERLPYAEQMASEAHALAVSHYHREVEKHFRRHPFAQTLALHPPLEGDFCLMQGAGGPSYHYGKAHYAWDLGACEGERAGQAVVAVAAGRVLSAEYGQPDRPANTPVDLKARANLVRIDHGGIISEYLHLRQGSGRLRVGDLVDAGSLVGHVGDSGVTTGPHLHFQVSDANGRTLPVRFSSLFRVEADRRAPVETLVERGRYSSRR